MAQFFIPREHGAIAMLLTPFFAAAILLRHLYWPEIFALLAIAASFTIKDSLVVIARQRFVWKQRHAEMRDAVRVAGILAAVLLACGAALILAQGWQGWVPFLVVAAAFSVLAVVVNVRNRQRSEWFQIASAGALSATSLVVCFAATGRIPEWCWLLWVLCTLQSASGILVVHSRIEARIAARGAGKGNPSRRSALVAQAVLILVAVVFAAVQRFWIAAALLLIAGCYLVDLRRQKDPASLQKPLKMVGLQSLAQSILYAAIVMVGLWRG
jgi:hypothetical protein